MKIYLKRCTSARVGFKADDYSLAQDADKKLNHLVLYHLEDTPLESVRTVLPEMMKHKTAFVLCFKGEMLAGLSKHSDVLKQVQSDYEGRAHILSFAIPSGGPRGALLTRLQKFVEYVGRSHTGINWTELDPEWKENLLAVYLAMRALAASGHKSDLERKLGPGGELHSIVQEAEKEYQMLQGDRTASLGLKSVSYARAGAVAKLIWETLRPLKI